MIFGEYSRYSWQGSRRRNNQRAKRKFRSGHQFLRRADLYTALQRVLKLEFQEPPHARVERNRENVIRRRFDEPLPYTRTQILNRVAVPAGKANGLIDQVVQVRMIWDCTLLRRTDYETAPVFP